MSVPAFIPRTISHTYVVGWPDHGIVKVGSTDRGRQRWGPFLCRGGVMLYLKECDNNLEEEVRIRGVLDQLYDRAFRCKEEAAPFLGNRGGGYLECYAIPADEWDYVVSISNETGEQE